jgi:hypothetical protein
MKWRKAEDKYNYLSVKYDKTYERLRVFEALLKEEPKLGLSTSEQERVRSMIREYTDFKRLCGRCKNEIIILAFIFYVKILSNPRLRLHKWRICKKYGLTNEKYMLIITRLSEPTFNEQ